MYLQPGLQVKYELNKFNRKVLNQEVQKVGRQLRYCVPESSRGRQQQQQAQATHSKFQSKQNMLE